MTCEQMRVALSARLDGEDPHLATAALDAHVAACAGCRAWLAGAERVARSVRSGSAAVPDLTDAIMAAVAADRAPAVPAAVVHPAGRARVVAAPAPVGAAAALDAEARGRRQVLRVAVAVAAVAQLALAVPALLSGLGVAADPHTSRELASLEIALAVGFLLAAFRPARARAFVPVAFVLAACLAGTSAVDMATANTAMVHEVGHLATVAQAALLWALGRLTPPVAPPAGRAAPGASTAAVPA